MNDDCTLLEKLTQYDSTLVEELTQFPVKDVLLLILKYVYIPILPPHKLQQILQFFAMLFEFGKPVRDDWLGCVFVNVYNLFPAYTVHLLSLPVQKGFFMDLVGNSEGDRKSKPEDLKYLFDIKSYTEFLFYCSDVYADTDCVITFAIFYMKTRGFVCVRMQKEFSGPRYSETKVDFGLYLCNDLDELLSYKNLSDQFYGTMVSNSKEHIPKIYDSVVTNSETKAKRLALWLSSGVCFQ